MLTPADEVRAVVPMQAAGARSDAGGGTGARRRAERGGRAGAAHMHNTRGRGLANCLAAYEVGVRSFDSSLGGLGGCPYAPGASGNVVTEDLVFMFEAMGLSTGVDIPQLIAAREPWRTLGDEILLRRHVRERAGATRAMGWVTDGLLHLFANPQPLARELRNRGMGLLNQLAPIKRFLTQRALDA